MLKIVDDYDLDDLEKYGFYKEYMIDEWGWIKEYKMGSHYKEDLIIWKNSKQIQANCIQLLSTLYDMIKDGIVENVGDK